MKHEQLNWVFAEVRPGSGDKEMPDLWASPASRLHKTQVKKFKRDGFSAPVDPDAPANDALRAIVNLAAHHGIMNAKSHATELPQGGAARHEFKFRAMIKSSITKPPPMSVTTESTMAKPFRL